MRDIKFRVWDSEENDLLSWREVRTGLIDVHTLFFSRSPHLIKEQYTGLEDRNGKEIYEGDILKGLREYKYKVVWEVCEFICYHLDSGHRWGRLSRLNDADMTDLYSEIEVIGNIHEGTE